MKGATSSRRYVVRLAQGVMACLTVAVVRPSDATAQVDASGKAAVGFAAVREGPITIDGRLNESAWDAAEPISGFVQLDPVEGIPAQHDTEVRILYDAEALYVGARMWDSAPDSIALLLTPRRGGGFGTFDHFEISFDSNNDRRTAYTFGVTAAGVQLDRFNYDDVRSNHNWTAVWESAVAVDEHGWTAEFRIPLSQLRYKPADAPQSWGMQISRRRTATLERSDFAFRSRSRRGWVSRFGHLENLVLQEGKRHVELLPYVLTRVRSAPAEPGNPFATEASANASAGLDLRFALGSTFMVDLAVNPDFGQVQVDPRVIDLSPFETFFPEQRPFFTRDDRMLEFPLSGGESRLFYSRRIGRQPQGVAPEGADFYRLRRDTRILGAAKLTGRTAGGLTIGALGAFTGRETGSAYFTAERRHASFVAEPGTGYGVLRAQQDFGRGESQLGAMLGLVHRRLPHDGSLDILARRALTGGVDFEHNWADRTWALWGVLAASHVTGSPAAITAIQRSPTHYFQRPDQDYLKLDPEATAINGMEWRLQFERRSGWRWTGSVWASQRTPGFEVNDLGYVPFTERLAAGARITYQQREPGALFRSSRVDLSTSHDWRNDALRDPFSTVAWRDAYRAGSNSATADVTLYNWTTIGLDVSYRHEALNGTLTRGGPLILDPPSRRVSASVDSDARAALSAGARAGGERAGAGGSGFWLSASMTVRPSSQVEIELGPRYQRDIDARQFVSMAVDDQYSPTFGARYLFADLDHRTLSMETRLSLILSPSFSFELYAQPLLSAGDHLAYKQLVSPSTFDFEQFAPGEFVMRDGHPRCEAGRICSGAGRTYVDFTGDGVPDHHFPNSDFNIRSLRGNAVLRWEYRPGSQIYLVWQQRRQDRAAIGDFNLGRDIRALGSVDAENILILKVSYWIG